MDCIRCKASTKVVDSATSNYFVMRRRKCTECGLIFFTNETPYDTPKLRKNFYKARKKIIDKQ